MAAIVNTGMTVILVVHSMVILGWRNDHQVDVGPMETELSGVRSVDIDSNLGQGFVNDFIDLADDFVFNWRNFVEDIAHILSKLVNFFVQFVIYLISYHKFFFA